MAELLHDLGIEPGALLVNLVSFILLIWLMRRYLFGTIGQFIEQRKRRIAQELDAAEEQRQAAEAERRDIEARRGDLLQAAQQGAEQVRQQALGEADELRDAARTAARDMERATRAALGREQEAAAAALRDEVSGTAAAMSRRILAQALTEERHRALLDEFIGDVERLAREQTHQ